MSKKRERILSFILALSMMFTACVQNTVISYADDARKADVWDFGGVAQEGDIYVNHITTATLDKLGTDGLLGSDGKFTKETTVDFDDVSIYVLKNDRSYYATGAPNAETGAYTKGSYSAGAPTGTSSGLIKYDDGYQAVGSYYCNGTGGEARRYVLINNVKAADKITLYSTPSNGVASTLYFTNTTTKSQQETAYLSTGSKYEFIADEDGTYKLWTDATAGKATYNRVIRTPATKVSGKVNIDNNLIPTGTIPTIIFKNKATNAVTETSMGASGSYSVYLTPGCEYVATLKGVPGIGFTNETKTVTVEESTVATNTKTDVDFTTEEKHLYDITGEVTGFEAGYERLESFDIVLTPEEDIYDTLYAEIKLDGGKVTYTVKNAEPDVLYTYSLVRASDYDITGENTVSGNEATTKDLTVALKNVYDVSGDIVTGLGFDRLEKFDGVKKIVFITLDDDDEYGYDGTVDGSTYNAKLRDGAYEVAIVADGYHTTGHVVVNGATTKKDILVVSDTATALPSVRDLYVGDPSKEANYLTVAEAVDAANRMNAAATSEDERITIHIAPGVYREQVAVTAPYITIQNDSSDQDVKLTWYYGIGYEYYSVDESGFYNFERAFDKFEKNNAATWGVGFMVKESAKEFKADGIIFEASFNKYITDEEIEDGVELNPPADSKITFARQYGKDVTSKAATERATAFASYADNYELRDCQFLGSQDTLFTGSKDYNGYFKNCYIEGNTDFIFGDGNIAFDNCEINIFGYSDSVNNVFLTAAKDTAKDGYLFRGCSVTSNDDMVQGQYYFGRPWGAKAKVTFFNTSVQNAENLYPAGWTSMSGAEPQNANFKEYNTTYLGEKVDTANRVAGTVMSDEDAENVDIEKYFGENWTPTYYVKETESTLEFVNDLSIKSNSDVSVPIAGNTFTASYTLNIDETNDNSDIFWYAVDATSGAETLVKVSNANSDKTYQLQKSDNGKKIKVKVVPKSAGGLKADAKEFLNDYTVDGTKWIDPDDATGIDPDASKINVYLAGDSTVKDYSADGMWNKGVIEDKGSWGEFLPYFLDKRYVNVMNYALGGRSSRTFHDEEDKLPTIATQITEGDYLFIQFGHNDCSSSYSDRYTPIGTPDANGIYPTTAPTATSFGTYKWYIKEHIKVAKEAGATPILCTPIARGYMNDDGSVKAHHFDDSFQTIADGNTYIDALKQVAEEENVTLIDTYAMTEEIYKDIYLQDQNAFFKQIMCGADTTHNGKPGGYAIAAKLAKYIKDMDISISPYVIKPSAMTSNNADGSICFSVNNSGKFTSGSSVGAENGAIAESVEALINEEVAALEDEEKPDLTTDPIDDPNWGDLGEFNTSATPAKLFIVGDSTACDYPPTEDATLYYKRVGFGTVMKDYFVDDLTVVNLALSGRSSKDFLNYPNYQRLKNEIGSGDFLIIAFGHNDEKLEDARYTNPNGSIDDPTSLKYSLYQNYIKVAQDVGATPILATPIVRRPTTVSSFGNNNLHITSGNADYAGGDYPKAIRELGEELGLTVIDNTDITHRLYVRCGDEVTPYFHSWSRSSATSCDNTHVNNYGANVVSYLMTRWIKLSDSPLKEYVKDAEVPTRDMLIVNSDYKEPEKGELTKSKMWQTTGDWWGSVYGDCGGQSKITKYGDDGLPLDPPQPGVDDNVNISYYDIHEETKYPALVEADVNGDGVTDGNDASMILGYAMGSAELTDEQVLIADVDEDGKVTANDAAKVNSNGNIMENAEPETVAVLRSGIILPREVNGEIKYYTNAVGKVSSTNEGMALYFRPVSAGTNFEIKAKATIRNIYKKVGSFSQVAFGAIVSQGMLTDTHQGGYYPDGYVAVGAVDMHNIEGQDEAGNPKHTMTNAWQRLPESAGGAMEKITCDRETVPEIGDTFDISIVKVGNKYTLKFDDQVYEMTADYKDDVYAGFFTARCIEVEYSDIVFNNEVVEEYK
ncbi:MAG: hypothetical protein IJ583_10315 [Firmicutes bacterium]|nr:hypothetical protein [Bacillota bacterium]